MTRPYRLPSLTLTRAAALIAAVTLATPLGADDGTPPSLVEPLAVFEPYVGRIVRENDGGPGPDWDSVVVLEPAVGGRSLRFTGRWDRPGHAREFVDGAIAWDPVDERIRIAATFFHGAYFEGEVVVLDAERHTLRREWTGHYPDGRSVPYRETWTLVSPATFEWRIEYREGDEWLEHRPPGTTDRTWRPIHRVERRPEWSPS